MGKRKRGPISKKVRELCCNWSDGRITDGDFTEGVRSLIIRHGETGYIFQGIGMAIEKWSTKYLSSEDKKQVWKLADEVDSRIRELFKNWVRIMSE